MSRLLRDEIERCGTSEAIEAVICVCEENATHYRNMGDSALGAMWQKTAEEIQAVLNRIKASHDAGGA